MSGFCSRKRTFLTLKLQLKKRKWASESVSLKYVSKYLTIKFAYWNIFLVDALKEEKREEDNRHLEIASGKAGPRQLQRAGKALANVIVKSMVC